MLDANYEESIVAVLRALDTDTVTASNVGVMS